MPRVQGIIQRLEQFTSKLSDSDDKQILRLRHGKIRKGAYKGTKKGRFKHWMAKPFISKKKKEKRKKYLADVTRAESEALASALSADISKRTPIPYEVDRQVTVQDVKTVLKASEKDRDEFESTVRKFVSSSATTSQLRRSPMDAARKYLDQTLMDRKIRHHDQIKQLQKQAFEIIDEQKRIKKSRRQPLIKGAQPLELKNAKKLKRQIAALVEEKMLSLALFREAEEYAMKEMVDSSEATPQKTVTDEQREKLLDSFFKSGKAKKRPNTSIALLAAEHMLANGFVVDEADIPNLDSNQPPEELEKAETALANEIKYLRNQKVRWAYQVADLLEKHKFKEARVVEDLARDTETMHMFGFIRDEVSDGAWNKYLNKQRKKIRKGKKIKLQSHDRKKVRLRGPTPKTVRPQTYFDQVRPWRGTHSRVETSHAKQLISRPTSYDGNIQNREAIVEQTLGMIQAKYRELSWVSNTSLLRELRDYLEENIHDRDVEAIEPVLRINKPLKGIPFSIDSVSSEDDLNEPTLSPRPSSSGSDDVPLFDTEKLEAMSTVTTSSGYSTDIANMEDVEGPDDVFEPDIFSTPPSVSVHSEDTDNTEAPEEQNKIFRSELASTSSVDSGHATDTGEIEDAEEPDEVFISDRASTSNTKKPTSILQAVQETQRQQNIDRLAQLIKPEQKPPPLDD